MHMIKIKQILLACILFLPSFFHPVIEDNTFLNVLIMIDGIDYSDILNDNSYDSEILIYNTQTLTIQSDNPFTYIYIEFNNEPSSYSISYNQTSTINRDTSFLHDYIKLDNPTTSCDITFLDNERIANIYVYDNENNSAQKWHKAQDDVDILVFATHADDEILFLGGVLALYAGEKDLNVQVVYLCEFYSTNEVREHEKLDGLWTIGVENYPVTGPFPDVYLETLDQALNTYSYPTMVDFVTENIRKFKPKVVVTQDINGEYGHGGHKILVKAVCESVDNSMDENYCPNSANEYGTHDVLKTYLHLYEANQIRLDLRKELDAFNGKNAIEIASEAYLKHVTQQWTGFYVTDNPEDTMYDASLFGLYRTTVGFDNTNDLFENVVIKEEEIINEEIDEEIKEETIIEEVVEEKEISETSPSLNNYLIPLIILFLSLVIILLILIFNKNNNTN